MKTKLPTIEDKSAVQTSFRPPSLAQVVAYCRERENQVDPRAFVDYYTSNGWKVGSAKMRNWQAAVRTWEHRQENAANQQAASVRHVLAGHAVWDAWKSMPDGPDKYQAYLCSPEWGRLRAAVTERSGGSCERCKVNRADAVHHLTYARKYAERLDDLLHECDGCHKYTHGLSEVDPILEHARTKDIVPLGILLVPTLEDYGEDNSTLLCPVCRCDFVHVEKPRYGYGKASEGITIPCWCESGHSWDLILANRDGKAFAFTHRFGMRPEYANVDCKEHPALDATAPELDPLEDVPPRQRPAHQGPDSADGPDGELDRPSNLDDPR